MKPYQPSQIVPAGGLIILILVALVGGAAIGTLVSLVSTNLIYVIILFPVLMGLAGGWSLAAAVRAGKVRNPGVAVAAAVIMGVMIFTSMWTADYYQERAASLASMKNVPPAEAEARFNTQLQAKTGQAGFLGFVLLRDQIGEGFLRQSDGSYWINLGPTWSWVYWALELVIILWLVVILGRKPAYAPFCEACQRWLSQPRLVGTLGASRAKEIQDLISRDQFIRLGEELQTNPALPNIGVYLSDCGPGCEGGNALLEVRLQRRGSNGHITAKDVENGMITAAQMQDLLRGVENRKALYGA